MTLYWLGMSGSPDVQKSYTQASIKKAEMFPWEHASRAAERGTSKPSSVMHESVSLRFGSQSVGSIFVESCVHVRSTAYKPVTSSFVRLVAAKRPHCDVRLQSNGAHTERSTSVPCTH